MSIRRARTRPAALAASLLIAGAGLGACSDTDESAGAAATDLASFCDSYSAALRAAITGDADGEVENLTRMVDTGPPELAAPLQRFTDAIVADGQEAAHEQLGQETLAEVGTVARTCEGDRLDLVAVDYGYENLPTAMSSGRAVVSLTNGSDVEEHEAIIMRKSDGVSLPVAELFQLSDEEMEAMIIPVSYLHAGNEAETWVVDLEPGEYIVACFLPVGGAEDGPPHAMEGMLAEFTVT